MTRLAYRVEHSPLWLLGRLFIPARYRRAACEQSGRHHPVLVDMGRSKRCMECGTW